MGARIANGGEEESLPALQYWLEGVRAHPLRWYFKSRRPNRYPGVVYAWWKNPILVAFEETLAILEVVQPEGLGAKRREFRAIKGQPPHDMEQFLALRAELTVASHLAASGVPFRFNGEDGPDLLIEVEGETCGIEVSSRRPKSLDSLIRELRQALVARGLPSGVSTSTDPIPPVAIRAHVRREILDAFLPPDGTPGVSEMQVEVAPERPEEGIPASWLTIRVGPNERYGRMSAPWNSPHMKATAQEVARNVMRETRKIRQSKLMPTVLIVDLSDTDLPDLRCWPEVFSPMWEESDQFLALAGMTMTRLSREPNLRFSVNPFSERRPVEALADSVRPCPVFRDLSDALAGHRSQRPA
ncbi:MULTISPECIES: hypothetical protein [unclassified Streptomyces]|uniref:hypothetical protein n=1 Tax=unclassified Streptomyces TaxID=2593676 RepID=UPI0019082F38|nr:hypothetical protein [Streptomyces sp. NE5-10]